MLIYFTNLTIPFYQSLLLLVNAPGEKASQSMREEPQILVTYHRYSCRHRYPTHRHHHLQTQSPHPPRPRALPVTTTDSHNSLSLAIMARSTSMRLYFDHIYDYLYHDNHRKTWSSRHHFCHQHQRRYYHDHDYDCYYHYNYPY